MSLTPRQIHPPLGSQAADALQRQTMNPSAAPLTVSLADEAATCALAARLADITRPGDLIALWGGLGAGKTTFARAFIRALTRADEDVPSPTFTLVQTYDGSSGPVWHFDLYRLDAPNDVWELGFEDIGQGITLMEWPERLGSLLPARRLDTALETGDTPASRVIRLTPQGGWPHDLEILA